MGCFHLRIMRGTRDLVYPSVKKPKRLLANSVVILTELKGVSSSASPFLYVLSVLQVNGDMRRGKNY